MIRIMLADDHAIVRSGLKQIIDTTTDMTVVGEAVNGADLLDKLRTLKPSLLLLDMSMPGISGVDLIRRVKQEHSGLPVLVLSMHNESQIVTRAFKAGACGYVTKDSEPEILLSAIRKVVAGRKFMDPALVDAMVINITTDERPLHESLSNREFQIFQMLVKGAQSADIAAELCLSAKTVSTHKVRLMQKLQIESNAELVRYAIKHGLAGETL